MRILLLDNYDSFTFNLVHYFEAFDCEVDVVRNDEIDLNSIANYDKVVLSPGPGLPKESNALMAVIENCIGHKPLLGVCLGFQAITEHFSGSLYNQTEVKHGIPEVCTFNTSSKLFKDLPPTFQVGLYHSWAVEKSNFPTCLQVTAESSTGVLMGFEHKDLPICGLQFHPESVLTENGKRIVENFVLHFE